MGKFWHFCIVTTAFVLAMASISAAQSPSKPAPAATNRAAAAKSLALPLFFEANQGQTDPRVRFLTRSNGYTLFLTPTETVFAGAKTLPKRKAAGFGAPPDWNRKAAAQAVVRMQLLGANSAPVMTGFEELPGKVNYLIGNDPAQWHTGVSLYSDVRSAQVYPGVDLVFHGDKRQLEYDFIVSPGADPSKIAFRIRGAARIEVDSQGNLVLHTAESDFRMYKPVVYQTVASERHAVEGSFVRKGKHEVAFRIGAYDRSQPLVIDPAIGYSTFLGGAGSDDVEDLEVDSSNPAAPKVYIAGFTTDTTTFPETSNPLIGTLGAQGYGYVAKIDPTITSGGTGSLDYLTFVGGHLLLPGNTGSQCSTLFEKFSLDLSKGTSGVEPVLGGLTSCSDYPGTPTQTVDGTVVGVLTRLNAAGNATDASIVFGGSGNNFDIYPFVDVAGDVIVAGGTSSTNYTATEGAYIPQMNNGGTGYADCFVAKLQRSNLLSQIYMTYLNVGAGTSALNGSDVGCGANEDASGIIGVGGTTLSTVIFNVGEDGESIANGFEPNAPAGATKAVFGMTLNPALTGTAQLVYGTYYGGGGITNPHTGTIDLGNGVVAIGGFTTSNTAVGDIPLLNAFQSTNLAAADNGETGFLVVVDTTQTGAASLLCSTYFGGSSGSDEINSVAYDASDPTAFRILIGGETASPFDFPTVYSLQTFVGTQDGFVAELNVPFATQPFNATLNFSTFIGGGIADRIMGAGVDANGTMYAAGYTKSSNFFGNTYPVTTVNGFQPSCTSCDATQPQDDTVVFSLTPAAGATLQTIAVSPVSATIVTGGTQQFQAEGYYSDGTVQDITTAVSTAWSSTQTAIATINAQGLATAGATSGDTVIVATNGNAVGEASVAVTAPGEFSLTILLAGSGYGSVSAAPLGCNNDNGAVAGTCTAIFASGTMVSLFEQPSTGSAFGGWSGAGCSGTANTCVVTVNANTTVTGTFNNGPGTNPVTITPAIPSEGYGTGTGTVTSSQYGINCSMSNGVVTTSSGPCAANFADGSFVTLTATPAAGSVFNYWGGGTCFGTSTCKLDAYTPQTATATFTAVSYALEVVGEGTGSGTISSAPAGINTCPIPSTCTANFPIDTVVVLSAIANPGSVFAGWADNGCTGTGTCTLTMNEALTVTATFNPVMYQLTVMDQGTGGGSVLSTPGGIECYSGSTEGCMVSFDTGVTVTLNATVTPGSSFAGFSSNCTSVTSTSCTVTMSAAETVTATFNAGVTLESIAVTPSTSSVPAGGTVQFTATGTYSDASMQNLTTSVNWTSSITSVATISNATGSQGLATGGATSGVVTITATLNGIFGTSSLTVTPSDIRAALVTFNDGTAGATVTWSPAFADTNYTAVCTAEVTPSDFELPIITLRTASSMTVIPTSLEGSVTGTLDCIAIPDSDTSDIRHGRVAFSDLPTTVTVNWNPVFSGTNYTVACTVETEEGTNGFTSVISSVTPSSVQVDNGQIDTGTMHCMAVPDTDTSGVRHGRSSFGESPTTVAVNWNNAFPDANYAAACSDEEDGVTSADSAIAIDEGSKAAGSINTVNEIYTGTVHCIAAPTAAEQFTVTVSPSSGAGSGTVKSQTGLSPAINCTTGSMTGCSANYNSGTAVTLTATPASGSTFAGWTDETCAENETEPCTFTVNGNVAVDPSFNLVNYTLTVSTAGTGGGTVTSQSGLSPAIYCTGGSSSGGCVENYPSGTMVVLMAMANDGSVFAGWSGNASCSGTGTCTVTMNAAESVTATFNIPPPNYTLAVSIGQPSSGSGTGTGTVRSQSGLSPAIDCTGGSSSGGCTESYPSGTVVTLTATPGTGSGFAGWSGACSGTGTCVVTMNGPESVTATFNTSTFTFTTGPGYSTTVDTTPGGNIVVGFTLSSTTATTVGLGCASSAPQYLSCLITPSEVSLTGNGPSQVAVVLTSYCQGNVPGAPEGPTPGMPGGVVGVMLLGMALCGVAWSYRGRRRWALSFAVMLLATVGGGACNNLPKGTAGATPPNIYTLTITATVAGQAPQIIQINVDVK
jgi:hypothetical protein